MLVGGRTHPCSSHRPSASARRARAGQLFIARCIVVATALLIGVGTIGTAAAQQGVGAKYAARDPRTCPNATTPTKGPPSAAQAALYLQCHIEQESGHNLYLISDVRVQVGKGTPYLELPKSERPFNGDMDGLVYAIRGSYKRYQCFQLSSGNPAGQNCTMYDESRASGTCFHDKFGDWVCNMSDLSALSSSRAVEKQPAPRS